MQLASPTSPEALASAASLPGTAARWPGDHWWDAYGDPQLAALIAQARDASPDVARATARIRQADAYAQQADAALLPTVGIEGSAGVAKQSYNNGIPAQFVPRGWNDTGVVAARAAFDLDLWGRNRAALAAARGEAAAARVDAQQALLLLSTAVADAYADLARLELEQTIAARAVAVREESLDLAGQRFRIGLDNRGTQELARSRAAGARAELAATDEAISLTRNRLAALVGAGPDRALTIEPTRIAGLAPRGLPDAAGIDLIGRRPDIVAARLRAEAAVSRIRAARAAFYPDIDITALFGLQALGLDQLIDSGSTYGNAGPAFSLPIFNRGQLAGDLRASEAASDIAVADYDATLIGALREVADAATSIRLLGTRQSEATEAVDAAQNAYDIAQQRFQGGLATYLDVLTAEDTVLQSRRVAADLTARAFTLDVALVRALGGGFADPTSQSTRADAAPASPVQGDDDGRTG